MGIPCICGRYYTSRLIQQFYRCSECGHVWDLRPDQPRSTEERLAQIQKHEAEEE